MIKRILFSSIIAFLLLPNGISFASVPEEVDRVIKEKMPYIADDIKHKPDLWGVKDPSKIPVRIGQPYQVYSFNNLEVVASVKDYKKGYIQSMLRPGYYWEYPLFDESGRLTTLAIIGKRDGVWELARIGPYLSEPNEAIEFFSANEEDIRKYLRGQGILNAKNIKHLRSAPLAADFIYAETEKEDYLIPLFAGIKSMPLEQKKIYPATDVLTVIARAEQRGTGGGIRIYPTSTAGIVSITIALVAMLAAIRIISVRRK